jgi:hypothetical protein
MCILFALKVISSCRIFCPVVVFQQVDVRWHDFARGEVVVVFVVGCLLCV